MKQLVLVGVAKGEDRVVLIDRLPESFTRRGMAYFLPRPLQNMILPPSMRVNSSVRTHSHDRVVGVSAPCRRIILPRRQIRHHLNHVLSRPCSAETVIVLLREEEDLTGSDVIRNLFMFELRRKILGIRT